MKSEDVRRKPARATAVKEAAKAACPLTAVDGKPQAATRPRLAEEGVGPSDEEFAQAPSAPVRRGPGRLRDTRPADCERCPYGGVCPDEFTSAGCRAEEDKFAELNSAAKLPKLVADALRAEFRTYFRAKKLETTSGGKIDVEASKMLQGILRAVESYLCILDRADARDGAPGRAPERPTRLHPSLELALQASGESLFSEVRDEALRVRLRRAYLEAIRAEDAVLRAAQAALGLAPSGDA